MSQSLRENQYHNLALMTDLYKLTMAASFFDHSMFMFQSSTFILFIRDHPSRTRFFISAGLESLLDYIEEFKSLSEGGCEYPVSLSSDLKKLQECIKGDLEGKEITKC
jgi:nicotinic acid phosphoribosyltransferase